MWLDQLRSISIMHEMETPRSLCWLVSKIGFCRLIAQLYFLGTVAQYAAHDGPMGKTLRIWLFLFGLCSTSPVIAIPYTAKQLIRIFVGWLHPSKTRMNSGESAQGVNQPKIAWRLEGLPIVSLGIVLDIRYTVKWKSWRVAGWNTVKLWTEANTLHGTNISSLGRREIIFKSVFWGDLLVPRRVAGWSPRFLFASEIWWNMYVWWAPGATAETEQFQLQVPKGQGWCLE